MVRPRVLHLAWILVLLSSVSAAGAGVHAGLGGLSCTAHYARVLRGEQVATPFAAAAPLRRALPGKAPQSAGEVVLRAAWGIRPPVAQVLALYATSSRAA